MGVLSVSVDADASALTVNGAMPVDGVSVKDVTGGLSVTVTVVLCVVASALPALSHARNLIVVVAVMLSGDVYAGLDVVGLVPLVVYLIAATPDPPVSVAVMVTETGPEYADVAQAELLQAIELVGPVLSICTVVVATGLALPALSTEKYLTAVVELTGIAVL